MIENKLMYDIYVRTNMLEKDNILTNYVQNKIKIY